MEFVRKNGLYRVKDGDAWITMEWIDDYWTDPSAEWEDAIYRDDYFEQINETEITFCNAIINFFKTFNWNY